MLLPSHPAVLPSRLPTTFLPSDSRSHLERFSQYPHERECTFPPLCVLEVSGTRTDGAASVFELRPSISLATQTDALDHIGVAASPDKRSTPARRSARWPRVPPSAPTSPTPAALPLDQPDWSAAAQPEQAAPWPAAADASSGRDEQPPAAPLSTPPELLEVPEPPATQPLAMPASHIAPTDGPAVLDASRGDPAPISPPRRRPPDPPLPTRAAPPLPESGMVEPPRMAGSTRRRHEGASPPSATGPASGSTAIDKSDRRRVALITQAISFVDEEVALVERIRGALHAEGLGSAAPAVRQSLVQRHGDGTAAQRVAPPWPSVVVPN